MIKYKKTCVYIGSFFKGKGVEQIFRLAKKKQKNLFSYLRGKKIFKIRKKEQNIKIFDYVNYSKIPSILSKYEVALMPYQKKVRGRGSMWLQRYMSPLKMFDYMAAKMIIIASDLKVYKHILKHNFNSILIDINKDDKWSEAIQLAFKKNYKNKYLKKMHTKQRKNIRGINVVKKLLTF